jgi:hypothetical protein
MHVRVVRQRRPPGVQHQRGADLRTQMLGIGRDGAQRLGRHLEQQTVDHRLVLYAMALIGAGSVKTTW